MKNKLLCILCMLLICLSLFFLASCDDKIDEFTSELGITLQGGNFEKGAKLITEKLNITDENVKKALETLPEQFAAIDKSDVVAFDISVLLKGLKVQPDGKVKVSVPAPIEGVKEYVVFHVKDNNETEQLDCVFKDGVVTFETTSFSMFIFGNADFGEKVTIKVASECEGWVQVNIPTTYTSRYRRYYLKNGEQQDFYIKQNTYISLVASLVDNYTFVGWFKQVDGVTEEKPFSTALNEDIFVEEGQTTIVAKFYADLKGVYQVWHFPGESNFPVGYSDGRSATSIYIKPGNEKGFDVNALVLKGRKNTDKAVVYVTLSPEQYTVTGLDKLDYSKVGEYIIHYKVNGAEDLVTEIKVNVSETNARLVAKAGHGGRFQVKDSQNTNPHEYFREMTFTITDREQKFTLKAIPNVNDFVTEFPLKFEFDGWYVYYEGGVLGEKLSDNPIYELNGDMGDLTVIAMFKILPGYSSLKGVYQLRLLPGNSGVPVDEDGFLVSEVFFKPGEPQIDLLGVEVKGLRRTADDKSTELVLLEFGDYTINYDGMDFRKEGRYFVSYTIKLEDGSLYDASLIVSVSPNHAKLTVEFEGEGQVEVGRYNEGVLTESGVPRTLEYFPIHDFLTATAVAKEGYIFAGWYSVDENGNISDEPVSTEAEFRFEQKGKDEHIKAVFVEAVSQLTVDGSEAGFSNGEFYYNLQDKKMPDLTKITVKTDKGRVLDESEYNIDQSNVDYTKTGKYQIVITYKYDQNVKALLTVDVPAAETYTYIEAVGDVCGVIKKGENTVVQDRDGYREEVDLGGTLTLTAVPNDGYKFAGWFVTHDRDKPLTFHSAQAEETFVITENTYIYARFVEADKVVFTVIAGEDGYVSEYHEQTMPTHMERLDLTVQVGKTVKVLASEAAVYIKFVGWFDGEGADAKRISTDNLHEFTVTEDTTVYARFEKAFYVSARIEGGGEFTEAGISAEEGFLREDLPENAQVTIEVKAKEGYRFVGWFISSDRYTKEQFLSDELKHTFTVNAETGNLNLAALFRSTVTEIKLYDANDYGFRYDNDGQLITEYLIGVNEHFYAYPDGITVLGKVGAGEQDYQELVYDLEYKVESTISYNENGMFDTSKTGTYTITYTYLANPDLKVTITIKVAELVNFIAGTRPYDGGHLQENGQKVEFGNGRRVEKGTQITLTAVPESMYNFDGWYYYNEQQAETLISSEATYTFTANERNYVYAKFTEKEMYNFIAYPSEAGIITENGQEVEFGNGRMVEKGTQITITATAKVEGYKFVGWFSNTDQNETLISTEATYTFTVNENMHVYARFETTQATN